MRIHNNMTCILYAFGPGVRILLSVSGLIRIVYSLPVYDPLLSVPAFTLYFPGPCSASNDQTWRFRKSEE